MTRDFETKTSFIHRKNAIVPGYWPIALDIGYSAVKGFSPNDVFVFPSFARKTSGQMLAMGEASPYDIQYKDNNGIWNVGYSAIASMTIGDSNDSLNSLYGRNRYFAPMFIVLARVGLGVAMMQNEFGKPENEKVILQTGLPPAYLTADAPLLKEALSGRHQFSLKIGDGKWINFDISLKENDIRIMAQPMGSLLGATLTSEGLPTPNANRYLQSNMLILDAGFGTVDLFNVLHRQIKSSESFDDLGMKAVLQRTAEKIYQKYHVEIPVHTMQRYLHNGTIQTFDRHTMTTKEEPFEDILRQCSHEVCMETLERIKTMYNNLLDYQYLLITGGTGAAWYHDIKNHFLRMQTLTVIGANQSDNLPQIYSNVRGYYLYQIGTLKAALRK